MKISAMRWSVIAAMVALMGCATAQHPPVAAPPAPVKPVPPPIRSVALLRVDGPTHFHAMNADDMAPGILGGAVVAAITASSTQRLMRRHDQELTQALGKHPVDYGDLMVSDIESHLKDAGIATTYLKDQKSVLAAGGTPYDYDRIHTDADAIIDVQFVQAGFYNENLMWEHFHPLMVIRVRVFNLHTHKLLYQVTYDGGNQKYVPESELIPLGKDYEFRNFKDLLTRIETGSKAFTLIENAAATRIANHVSGKNPYGG